MRAIYTGGAGGRRRNHPLVRLIDRPKRPFRARRRRIDGPWALPYKPRKIACRSARNCGFSWRIAGAALSAPRRHGATSGELNREADLSTEQACTQAPSRFPRAHGHQGRTQGGGGAARARAQAAVRLTRAAAAEAVRGACFHGTIEATGGLSGSGGRAARSPRRLSCCRRAGGRMTGRCVSASPCRRRSAMRSSATGFGAACGKWCGFAPANLTRAVTIMC